MSPRLIISYSLLVILLASVWTAGVTAENIVLISVNNSAAYPGDSVSFTCNVRNFQTGQFVQWFKRILYGDEYKYQKIGKTTHIDNSAYSSTGRYKVEKSQKNKALLLTLIVTGIQKEDNGTIGCLVPRPNAANLTDGKYAMVDFTVLSPPNIATSPRGPLYFTEGKPLPLYQCNITGSTVFPILTVFMGRKNITNKFKIHVTKQSPCDHQRSCCDAGSCTASILYTEMTAAASVSNLMASGEDDGTNLTCLAQAGNKGTLNSISMPVHVIYKPKITGCPGKLPALEREKASFPCMVRANPPVTSLYWKFQIDGEDIKLKKKKVPTATLR